MVFLTAGGRVSARLLWAVLFLVGAALLDLGTDREWPGSSALATEAEPADQALIRAQRVCILNAQDSAGEIGKKLVFRSHRDGDRLSVAYFVHWSTERPWGDKPMLMSLAIDSFYSHFFFVMPGLRHLMHGPGDVEGATVVYRVVDGRLEALEGFADDESHDPVHLSAQDLTDAEQGTVLMTSVWSHQLGSHGAAQAASLAAPGEVTRHCYQGQELVPLTSDIAERFWLGSADKPERARPAWR
jgi:hypothetical protein